MSAFRTARHQSRSLSTGGGSQVDEGPPPGVRAARAWIADQGQGAWHRPKSGCVFCCRAPPPALDPTRPHTKPRASVLARLTSLVCALAGPLTDSICQVLTYDGFAPTIWLGTLASMPSAKFAGIVIRAQYYHDGDNRWMDLQELEPELEPEPEPAPVSVPMQSPAQVEEIELAGTAALPRGAQGAGADQTTRRRQTFFAPSYYQQLVGVVIAAAGICFQLMSTRQLSAFFDGDMEDSCRQATIAASICHQWSDDEKTYCLEWDMDHDKVATLLERSCSDICDPNNDTESFYRFGTSLGGDFICEMVAESCMYKDDSVGKMGNFCSQMLLPGCCQELVNTSRLYLFLAMFLSSLGILSIIGIEGAVRLGANSLFCCFVTKGGYYHDNMVYGYHELIDLDTKWTVEQASLFIGYRVVLVMLAGGWWKLWRWRASREEFDNGEWNYRVHFLAGCYLLFSAASVYAMWVHADRPALGSRVTLVTSAAARRRQGVGIAGPHLPPTSAGNLAVEAAVNPLHTASASVSASAVMYVTSANSSTCTIIDSRTRGRRVDRAGFRTAPIVHVEGANGPATVDGVAEDLLDEI